ncbi:uncharacterized protein DNG_06094 [Cephalotrichum gorgonifer]|uniref:DUF7514 domain-containing protein n=1 Tax=Cephalotrichum gorgonifer TaxID=2041049 RepID=A0AAE8MZ06_9PEZI|nr:uncharacterized protein DNG_06094 [Cephalotrichum gorgonifer]
MMDMIVEFLKAGGYEGVKNRIVEEVREQLKSDNSDRESLGSSPSPPPPRTGFSRAPPPSEKPASRTSGRKQEDSFSKSAPFSSRSPSGPSLPQTPPASPRQRPQDGRPGGTAPSGAATPQSYQAQAKPAEDRESKLSPVDKSWGDLYDANGRATKRLGQVLRGVANYLISQSSTPENAVVSPSNLAAFYAQFSVDNEPHPYPGIFKCKEGNKEDYKDIRYIYDELDCEYHLVKIHPTSSSRPMVPALTPAGFVKWFTMSIYAYPDEEAARLDAVMSRLPIDANGEGKPERLPKQLSRYLLPPKSDKSARKNLDEVVQDVLDEREHRDKKRRMSSYGAEGIASRPESRRSESAPIPHTRESTRAGDEDAEENRKKRSTKSVSFGRLSSKRPDTDGGAAPTRPSRRDSSDRAAGRPYNFHNGKSATAATSERRSSNEADPVSPSSPLPSPTSPHFELSSGRDRPETRRYSRDAAPRRMSSPSDEVPRSSSRQKSRRHSEVVIEQDKGPGWRQPVYD